MRILVVDDDGLAAEMTSAILESQGHTTILCENGVEALEKIDEGPAFALIVSDLNMPLVSGIDLFTTLRDQGNQTPFLLLTGDDPEKVRVEVPGLDGCLMKDFSLEQTLPGLIAQVTRTK